MLNLEMLNEHFCEVKTHLRDQPLYNQLAYRNVCFFGPFHIYTLTVLLSVSFRSINNASWMLIGLCKQTKN